MDTHAPTRTALVVDDDDAFRLQLRLGLERAGFRVLEAASEAEAITLAQTDAPDLALLDLMMEHQDSGFVLAWRLRRMKPDLPVIIVTAVTGRTGMDFEAVSRADRRWVQADAVLTKPIRFEQLQQRVEAVLAARAG